MIGQRSGARRWGAQDAEAVAVADQRRTHEEAEVLPNHLPRQPERPQTGSHALRIFQLRKALLHTRACFAGLETLACAPDLCLRKRALARLALPLKRSS